MSANSPVSTANLARADERAFTGFDTDAQHAAAAALRAMRQPRRVAPVAPRASIWPRIASVLVLALAALATIAGAL